MLNVWIQDCMTRIFPNQLPPENMSKEIRLQVARNEVGDFQIGISGPPDELNDLHVEASDLVSEDGKRISKESVDVLYAEYVPVHWGLNHWGWHPPVYTEHEYNPYDNTTGGSLQAGDSYVLYPPRMASETDEPVDSIRWEIMRKAMEDYEYLYMLRELADAGNEQAGKLLRELEEDIVPSFTGHTRDPRSLEDFRLRVGQIIASEWKG